MLGPRQQTFRVNFDSARNYLIPNTQQSTIIPYDQQPSSGSPVLFHWSVVDGICVPCVVRNGKLFVPVRVIEQKLLQPVMAIYPTVASTIKRPLLTSYYVTHGEAETLTLRTSQSCGTYAAGVDLVVSFDEFRSFYAELKSLCCSATTESGLNLTGGWVQINNSVIPYVNVDGGKYLPLSVVQNAARLLNNVERSALSVRRLSPSECRLMNDLCNSAGLLFVVDPTTDVIDILTVCGMAHQTPVIRFLPSEDPFGCAQFMDVPEDAELKVNVDDCTVKQPMNGLHLPNPRNTSYSTTNDLKIIDVRGNVEQAYSGAFVKGTADVDVKSASGFGQLSNASVNPPIVEPVIFQDRTVSSLRREDGKNYILLEAICRVFFPSIPVDAFINCIEHVLRIPLTELTVDEERHFIKFYHLPTNCLRCRKLITFENLQVFYPQLKYSFRAELQGAATTMQQLPFTVGTITVQQPSAVKKKTAPVSHAAKPTNKHKRRKMCTDVILIDD